LTEDAKTQINEIYNQVGLTDRVLWHVEYAAFTPFLVIWKHAIGPLEYEVVVKNFKYCTDTSGARLVFNAMLRLAGLFETSLQKFS
jgi:hypothetical protein